MGVGAEHAADDLSKAVLTKLDPEVATEVARAMNAVPDDADDLIRLAAVEILERVLPDDHLEAIHDRMV